MSSESLKGTLLHYEVIMNGVVFKEKGNYLEKEVPCNKTTNFTIAAVNSKGRSLEPSVFILPKEKDGK